MSLEEDSACSDLLSPFEGEGLLYGRASSLKGGAESIRSGEKRAVFIGLRFAQFSVLGLCEQGIICNSRICSEA